MKLENYKSNLLHEAPVYAVLQCVFMKAYKHMFPDKLPLLTHQRMKNSLFVDTITSDLEKPD